MHDDGYDGPHHFSGWLAQPEPKQVTLSSDELCQVSGFLDALDESGANFAGTVQFNGHSFVIGFDRTAEEHFIVVR